MNKYIKKFKDFEELQNYIFGSDYVTPNLLYIEGFGTVGSKKLEPLTFTINSGGDCPREEKGGELRNEGCGRIELFIPAEITSNQLLYVEYSVDGGETWERYTVPDDIHEDVSFGPRNLNQGDSVMFRGKGSTLVTITAPEPELEQDDRGVDNEDYVNCAFQFENVNEAECHGDVMSLPQLPLDIFEEFERKNTKSTSDIGQFWDLFFDAPITTMPKLPKNIYMIGSSENYQGMFSNTFIEDIILPEKYVPSGCYDHMFESCRNIREITILAEEWEDDMIPENMFQNSNIFNNMINLYIPSKMFSWYQDQDFISQYWNVYDVKTGEVLQEGEEPQQAI